ncbi:MAG: peptide deformylase [Planctomycetes bacterium]|nr:peptide deformylase [Planctomycetota bacterium]
MCTRAYRRELRHGRRIQGPLRQSVGLAAVQVGELVRAIVYDVGDGLVELLNPELIDFGGEQYGPEGCLSIPGVHADVRRYDWVKVKGLDRSGNQLVVEGEELLARCLQHEIDHLNGVLFTDHIEEVINATLE